MKKKPTLAEFIAANHRQVGCRVCGSPHRAEIEAERKSGASAGELMRALKSVYKVTIGESSIRRHFASGHDEQK